MIDLDEARALAAAARADTSDGLEAREALIPVALEMMGEIEIARSLRVTARSLEPLIDRERHSPARVHAYLVAHGWTLAEQYPERSDWTRQDADIGVLDVTRFADYERYLSRLAGELADEHGVGELQVLADIEAAGDG